MAAFITFQPSDFFNVVNYTGTGAEQTITGVGFAPNFSWAKKRDGTDNHALYDTARGATKRVMSNEPDAESTIAQGIKSWTSDGFVVGTDAEVNANTRTYASWNWKGGTTSGIATNGSTTITPSAYSFSQTAGFSALAYTGNATSGAKLAHGLGATPTMVWVKNLQTANNWSVYQKYVKATSPEDWTMQLDSSAATSDNVGMWNDTQPDDVNITLGNDNGTNGSYNFVAYCFAPIQGQQIFGRYYGNGNANGPYIQTNFRPKFVVLKRLDGTTSWVMFYNPPYTENDASAPALWVNTTATEGAYTTIDFLSNGFKIRDSSAVINTNGSKNVYWAFAEFPFVSSNSKAVTAR